MTLPPPTIPRQRAIIDRRALDADLADIGEAGEGGSKQRGRVLERLKTALAGGRAEIRRRFEETGANGPEVAEATTFLMDQLIRTVHDYAITYAYPRGVRTSGEQVGIAAVGGYGRRELAPGSDLDLLFLLPHKPTAHSEQVVEFMLYMLWDLGLKVGHATRSVDDCVKRARQDLTIRTNLLEARRLWGSQSLFHEFERRYWKDVVDAEGVAAFVEAKLQERAERHARLGGSRYVLEPDVKESPGGLRDLQTLYWIARYAYRVDALRELVERDIISDEVADRFVKAHTFLTTVRCHLHYAARRAEDRLTFDRQPELGGRMGYTDHAGASGVERFMKHYFLVAKDVGDLTGILCAVLEEQHKRKPRLRLPSVPGFARRPDGFVLSGGRLAVDSDDAFDKAPDRLIRLFHTAHRLDAEIHPRTLNLAAHGLHRLGDAQRHDPELNGLFRDILCGSRGDPSETLRRMSEAGVLGRFVPDFGRVVAQMQYDMYHVYTVDEHTIRALGTLHALYKGRMRDIMPQASDVAGQIHSPCVLAVALFLHDIAKGRGGDHAQIGARIARKLGPRFGLDPAATETVSWLVLHHLDMSRTAFKRDMDDPKTVFDFAGVVQSPERLRLLFLLTAADIHAVGPNAWNGWKAALLRELYVRTEEVLSGGFAVKGRERRIQAARDALRDVLRADNWSETAIDLHLARPYPYYWLSFDTETHRRHARFVREADTAKRPVSVATRVDRDVAGTEVLVYAPDHAGLFAAIAGGIAVAGLSVVDAKITTFADGTALDTFWVQKTDGTAPEEAADLDKLRDVVVRAADGRLRPDHALADKQPTYAQRTRSLPVAPRVIIDNQASNTHTVIEVNGRDRPGFLYAVTAALNDLGLQVSSAHISTWGVRAVDVFYVKDIFGVKVDHEGKLNTIRRRLLAVVAEDAAPGESPAPDSRVA